MLDSLDEDKRELCEALSMHPSLINSLLYGDGRCQSSDSITRLSKDIRQTTKKDNEILWKWFKREKIFHVDQTLEKISNAFIHIGRVDLAYTFRVNHLSNSCLSHLQ